MNKTIIRHTFIGEKSLNKYSVTVAFEHSVKQGNVRYIVTCNNSIVYNVPESVIFDRLDNAKKVFHSLVDRVETQFKEFTKVSAISSTHKKDISLTTAKMKKDDDENMEVVERFIEEATHYRGRNIDVPEELFKITTEEKVAFFNSFCNVERITIDEENMLVGVPSIYKWTLQRRAMLDYYRRKSLENTSNYDIATILSLLNLIEPGWLESFKRCKIAAPTHIELDKFGVHVIKRLREGKEPHKCYSWIINKRLG